MHSQEWYKDVNYSCKDTTSFVSFNHTPQRGVLPDGMCYFVTCDIHVTKSLYSETMETAI